MAWDRRTVILAKSLIHNQILAFSGHLVGVLCLQDVVPASEARQADP